MVDFSEAYFIKLGRGGRFEKECIESGTLRLGFTNPFHEQCKAGDFAPLEQWFSEKGKAKGQVTSIVNQVRTFYEADEEVLWITFYNQKLWWAFAAPGIEQLEDGSRIRQVVDEWRSDDVKGEPLSVDRLSGRLTKVQMFQGTICRIKEQRYLRRRISGKTLPEVEHAQVCVSSLVEAVLSLIRLLTWRDFELLVDLLFVNAGWKRLGVVGKTQKDIDLDLLMPLNGRRAFVQVKSSSTQEELNEYVETFSANDTYDEMYYVVHTSKKELRAPKCKRPVTVLEGDALARLIVDAGMVNWLINVVR